ncbi:MAG: PspC domain-containing protein [Candidatus Pacebacteria bacterium]|nr:PspC domain-containing protein [Candidatus Paceibacterota bacterium]
MGNNTKKIYRSQKNRIIFGVCGGLAEYFEIDPLLIRIFFILLVIAGGSGVLFYLILAVLIPKEENKVDWDKDNLVEETKKRTKELAKEIKENESWIKNSRNILGLIIIVLGLNLLFSELFRVNFLAWGVVWALIIIFIGFKIIKK